MPSQIGQNWRYDLLVAFIAGVLAIIFFGRDILNFITRAIGL